MPSRTLFIALCVCGIFAVPLAAQDVNVVGEEATFDIATWNIEWFGSSSNGPSNDELQIDNVAKIIAGAGIDLWGVQEIADENDFNALLSSLGSDFDGTLATNSVEQKIGFIYDTNVVQVRQIRHILEEFSHPFASRPPLQLEATVTLPDTSLVITFIVVHMKAFSDVESYERRVDASSRLKNHIDFTALDREPVILLGDFNDELERSTSAGRTSPYVNFVDDPDGFSFLTLPLEQAGAGSFCSNASCTSTGSFLDHILITDELFASYLPGSAGFIPDLTSDINLFGNSTSDHLPVVARFDFTRTSVDVEYEAALPVQMTVTAPYPNPFVQATTLTLTLGKASPLNIEVFDLLGRPVDTLFEGIHPPGRIQYSFQSNMLPRGLYMIRVEAGAYTRVMPVTLIR